jgi:hypothetical protein
VTQVFLTLGGGNLAKRRHEHELRGVYQIGIWSQHYSANKISPGVHIYTNKSIETAYIPLKLFE